MVICKSDIKKVTGEVLEYYCDKFKIEIKYTDVEKEVEKFTNSLLVSSLKKFKTQEQIIDYCMLIIRDIVVVKAFIVSRKNEVMEYIYLNYFSHLRNLSAHIAYKINAPPEDLLHDFFYEVFKEGGIIEKYDPSRGSLKNYLFKKFIYYTKEKAKKMPFEFELRENQEWKYIDDREEEFFVNFMDRERLKRAFECLPTMDKMVLYISYPLEISEIMSYNVMEPIDPVTWFTSQSTFRKKKQEALDRYLFAFLYEKYGKNKPISFFEKFLQSLDDLEQYIFIRILPVKLQKELSKRGFHLKPSFYSAEALRRNLKSRIQLSIKEVRERVIKLWENFADNFQKKSY
ncbi:MAG TPA: sigma-70 family RNA polymerase sigma factor [candidate division WOR-3 bacterium]|uniref:Sigma-70 family RNA polymerase sigma factor n=1 Tax=candidate division WOR-3 bacterium TaxID=2052148 RepID=A0A7V0Q5S9_UNCW3|nr:sigma-70 family RNA polymerase sigma factor [candidate division WOR-3 bacterium]